MKEIKKYIQKRFAFALMSVCLLGLQSCEDFLDVEPEGPTSGNFFNTEEEYNDALIGAYDMLQSSFWNVLSATVASDDIIAGGDPATGTDQPSLQAIDKMDITPIHDARLEDIWELMYSGLHRANFIMENKDKIDFEGKSELLAEALFLRAYYCFELAKFYGDIPLKVEQRDGVMRIADTRVFAEDLFELTRVGSIAEVYALIEEDLKEAIESLPEVQENVYEVTKGAAQSLLGKVYLYHGKFDASKFQDAATVLNEVIASGNYALVDFDNLFTFDGENGAESVFEIQYTNVQGTDFGCEECGEGTYLPKWNAPRSATIETSEGAIVDGWGFCLPTQALYDAYDSADLRRDISIWDLRNNTQLQESHEHTGFYTRKYLPFVIEVGAAPGSPFLTWSNNYRAIRYADVLLMAAEAEVQSGGSVANATLYLNEVRQRAFGDNSHDYPFNGESDLLQAIYDERRLEFVGEGHRFFDLVRTNQAEQAFANYNANKGANAEDVTYDSNKNEVLPFPQVQINLADAATRWGQNEGY